MQKNNQKNHYRIVGNIGSGKLWQIDKISSWQKNFGEWTQ